MNDQPKITLEDVMRVADEVTSRYPDRLNPPSTEWSHETDKVNCLYTDPDVPALHCLGGEILLRLGCRLPAEQLGVCDSPDADKFEHYDTLRFATGEGLTFLTLLQFRADQGLGEERGRIDGYLDFRLEWREAYEGAVRAWERGDVMSELLL